MHGVRGADAAAIRDWAWILALMSGARHGSLGGFGHRGIPVECPAKPVGAGRGSAMGAAAGRSGRVQPMWLKPCRPTVAIVIAVMAKEAKPIIRLRVMLILSVPSGSLRVTRSEPRARRRARWHR